jgi:hydroxyacylglutathione hydrolase
VPETPVYFLHSRDMNQAGPSLRANEDMPPMLAPGEFAARVTAGAVMLDTRPAGRFAPLHPAGALNVGLDGQYASWVGTLVRPDQEIVLICEPGREEEAVMRLARVGYENVVGILEGGVEAWKAAGLPVASIGLEPVTQAIRDGRTVLDVRRAGEWNSFHVKDAVHAPLSSLPQQLETLDRNAEYVVVCATGYRSAIAASLLARAGFGKVTSTTDGMDGYRRAGLPLVAAG